MIINPTYLGAPLYPGGLPLPPANVSAGDKTIKEIYLRHSQADQPLEDDEETLKSYSIYYASAPLFDAASILPEGWQYNWMKMTFENVWHELLDLGLDPQWI